MNWLRIAFPALLFAFSLSAKADVPTMQHVAEVEGTFIGYDQLDSCVLKRLGSVLAYIDDDQLRPFQREVLEQIIDWHVLYIAARQYFKVAATEVTTSSASKPCKLDTSKLVGPRTLAESSYPNLIDSYLQTAVLKNIEISDASIEKYYWENKELFFQEPEVKARHILIRARAEYGDVHLTERRRHAEHVLELARKDAFRFTELAKRYSEGPVRAKGGYLGFFTKNQLPKVFAEAAFSLEAGAVSDIVRTRHGFHIIKIEERRGGNFRPLSEVSAEIKNRLERKARAEAIQQHIEKLRQKFKVIAYLG